MRIPRVYCDSPLAEGVSQPLDAATSHYMASVLRLKAGAQIHLFNGQGGEYRATLTEVNKRSVQVDIEQWLPGDQESPLDSHLAIGISRGERMDLVVQKATELGVSQITPLFTERTEVKLKGERLQKRLDHWHKIITSACEQSGRNILPVLHPPLTLTSWLQQAAEAEVCSRWVLHHRAESRALSTVAEKPQRVQLLIGPEGGLSQLEVEQALSSGYNALRLGPRVMRTETAPLAALSLLQYLWGDLD